MGKVWNSITVPGGKTAVVVFTAWTLVVIAASCKTPEKIIVLRQNDPCVFVPPPRPKPVDYNEGQLDGGCTYVSCLSSAGADALEKNLAAQQQWEAETWLRCGPFDRDAGR